MKVPKCLQFYQETYKRIIINRRHHKNIFKKLKKNKNPLKKSQDSFFGVQVGSQKIKIKIKIKVNK